jgi:hypothetical protein
MMSLSHKMMITMPTSVTSPISLHPSSICYVRHLLIHIRLLLRLTLTICLITRNRRYPRGLELCPHAIAPPQSLALATRCRCQRFSRRSWQKHPNARKKNTGVVLMRSRHRIVRGTTLLYILG